MTMLWDYQIWFSHHNLFDSSITLLRYFFHPGFAHISWFSYPRYNTVNCNLLALTIILNRMEKTVAYTNRSLYLQIGPQFSCQQQMWSLVRLETFRISDWITAAATPRVLERAFLVALGTMVNPLGSISSFWLQQSQGPASTRWHHQ
jgi:hypothetical protein